MLTLITGIISANLKCSLLAIVSAAEKDLPWCPYNESNTCLGALPTCLGALKNELTTKATLALP